MDRHREQAELLGHAGRLFGPLLDMVDDPSGFDATRWSRTFARFCASHAAFDKRVAAFMYGEPGHHYQREHSRFEPLIGRMLSNLNDEPFIIEEQAEIIRATYAEVLNVIRSVPMPPSAATALIGCPFTAYCLILDRLSAARDRVILVDPYLDASIFYRYLRDLAPGVEIELVTLDDSSLKYPKDARRHQALLDASLLFASERTAAPYRLCTKSGLHGRFLVVDDVAFLLDGSVKDAAVTSNFTISITGQGAAAMGIIAAETQGATTVHSSAATISP